MRTNLAFASGSSPWPEPGQGHEGDDTLAGGREPPGSRERARAAAITEIVSAMSDTRRLVLVSGGLLAADVAGMALAVPSLLGHGHGVAWGSSALLVPVALSWLVAALFLVLGERPAAVALGELRRTTGAPVDLSAPWRSLGVRPLAGPGLEPEHVTLLIGAATAAHARARLTLWVAVVATAGFLLWTAISLAMAAVS
ncbi:MAG: hypothetical protein J2P25_13365 [Nocardiopsaceae bacterium]|nr:hypothetical protein [Nocardiopsaceae bacterium]